MTILVIVMHSHSFLMGQKMSMISRIITTGAIYKKVCGFFAPSILILYMCMYFVCIFNSLRVTFQHISAARLMI